MSIRRGIDHLVIAVRELPAAREQFERVGFGTTPLGRQPWGTANHLVQFPQNFIELVGVVDRDSLVPMSDDHFSFSAHNDQFLQGREGLSMLVLSTDDARADAETWRAHGLRVFEPLHWSRKATLPDGSETTVAFTLAFVVDADMPEIAFFSCQQHNPAAFWKSEYQSHANSAARVAHVSLIAERPAQHREFFAALVGKASIEQEDDALRIETAEGAIHVLSPERFAARFPAARPPRDTRGTVLMAAGVEVADLQQAADCLERNGIPFTRSDVAIQIGGEICFGLTLELIRGDA